MKQTSPSKKKNTRILKAILILFIALAMVVLYCVGSFAFIYAEEKNGIDLGAQGAAVYVGESNSFFWEYQGDQRFDPASITKLLTCLIVAEKLDMDQVVTVTAACLDLPSTWNFLVEGEEITVRDLMYLSLLESHNEAAKMLAIAVSGTEEAFAVLMNQRANEIGCINSEFHNSHGLTVPEGNFATPKDICRITKAALDNPIVREVCETATYTMPATNKHPDGATLHTTNLFLEGGKYTGSTSEISVAAIDEVYGGKTGTTVQQVTTMSVGCEVNGVDVYICIMGSTVNLRYTDVARLVAYAKANIQPYQVFPKGTEFEGKARVKEGAVKYVDAVAGEDCIINLPEGASPALVMVEPVYDENLTAPVKEGDVVGQAVVYLADEKVDSVDLVALKDVEKGWIFSKIGLSNMESAIIIGVTSLFLILLLWILTQRAKNKRASRKRREEMIREMALRQMEQEESQKQRGWHY
ncbi:MAG: D-alanyl-D-alanine carboxypeptidase [Firmicutes bacterium]|nr:D-alanyl-D-alanine carboxypeptidase [Bacillota bacterium]